jgi:hypothetical protein
MMKKMALAGKLRMQAGQRVLIMSAPQGYLAALEPLPEGLEVFDCADGRFDLVQLFVKSVLELEELGPVALKAVTYDGLLWISYPKRSSKVDTDISRDTGWDVISQAGLRPVAQISIDETWSALRFRPAERIGKSK